MTLEVTITPAFSRDLKRLKNKTTQQAVSEALQELVRDGKTPRLNFEAVRSKSGYFTIRADYSTRILLREAIRNVSYEAVAVGNHDYVYRSFFR